MIAYSLFPRYLEPLLLALESGQDLPCTSDFRALTLPFFLLAGIALEMTRNSH